MICQLLCWPSLACFIRDDIRLLKFQMYKSQNLHLSGYIYFLLVMEKNGIEPQWQSERLGAFLWPLSLQKVSRKKSQFLIITKVRREDTCQWAMHSALLLPFVWVALAYPLLLSGQRYFAGGFIFLGNNCTCLIGNSEFITGYSLCRCCDWWFVCMVRILPLNSSLDLQNPYTTCLDIFLK